MLLNVHTTVEQARRDALVRAGAVQRGRDRRRWIRRAAAVVAAVAVSAALCVEPAKAQGLPSWLLITDQWVDEGGKMTFEVMIAANGSVPGGFTVTPTFTDGSTQHSGYGTAKNGTDYTATANPATLTFKGNASEKHTFTVVTTEDSVAETTEIFTVNLSVSGTEARFQIDDATGYINDDDTATLTIANASASEGDGITFTATLDTAVQGGFTATPSFTDGTATSGTDYTENTAGISFEGTAGESKTFTVATTEDQAVEAGETFTVNLAISGTNATVTATDTATGTINNDDAPALSIDDASATEGGSMTFTVTLDAAVSGQFYVDPSFTDGTATKGTDYTEYTEELAFAGRAGETHRFTVATTEDTDVETDESFTVSLRAYGTSETITASDTAKGTILDDDAAPAVTVGDASADEGGSMTFTVTLDKAVEGGLTVTPSFTDGTAAKGTDYTENTAALTFAGTAGESQSFTVATTGDEVVEADETFTVGLTVSGTSETVTATGTATGTIDDDDAATVALGTASSSEGTAISMHVYLDKAVQGGFTVTPSFTDGTATKGTDYTENTAQISFAGTAGESKTLEVETTEDAVHEPDETFTVSLSVSGTSLAVTTTPATGTILNDDAAPPGPAVTVADTSAAEGESMTFTVTLDKRCRGV